MATAPKFGTVQRSNGLEADALLERLLQVARELPAGELPDLIGQLEAFKAMLWGRLLTPTTPQEHDELLDVAEAARRLGVSEDYLYRHSGEYPFTRRQGRKLLFSAQGIDRFIKQKDLTFVRTKVYSGSTR